LFKKSGKKVAAAPGTMHFVGEQKVDEVKISLIDYDPDKIEERELANVAECLPFRDTPSTSWINVYGLHDIEALRSIGDHFGLHPLVQEDIVNTHQRPKLEDFGNYLFIVARMIRYDPDDGRVESEQVSIVVGRGVILSFQERPGDVFEGVRERLRQGRGRIRGGGAGYLAYALLDAIVDHYFGVLETLGEVIENLERELLATPEESHLNQIHELKREMLFMRRSTWPLREVVGGLLRGESPHIAETAEPFVRDVYDHVIQVADGIDTFREMLSGLQDLYLSSASNRMNDVMKVLTIFASIFVPLTFVAGIYGMNFEHMPELGWKWSYAVFWAAVLIVGGAMVAFFRRKGWL
jgi:magnesium transporter